MSEPVGVSGVRVQRLDHLGIVAGVCEDPHSAAARDAFWRLLIV